MYFKGRRSFVELRYKIVENGFYFELNREEIHGKRYAQAMSIYCTSPAWKRYDLQDGEFRTTRFYLKALSD